MTSKNFRGKHFIHVRIFEDYQDCKGFRPTKRGISIDISLAGELEKWN